MHLSAFLFALFDPHLNFSLCNVWLFPAPQNCITWFISRGVTHWASQNSKTCWWLIMRSNSYISVDVSCSASSTSKVHGEEKSPYKSKLLCGFMLFSLSHMGASSFPLSAPVRKPLFHHKCWFKCFTASLKHVTRWLVCVQVAVMDEQCVSHSSPQRSGGHPGTEVQRPNVIRCGWLRKQGGFVKTWHNRWFVLRGDQLYYYKDEEETKALVRELSQKSLCR